MVPSCPHCDGSRAQDCVEQACPPIPCPPCIWHRIRSPGLVGLPTCSKDGQREVGDGFPGVGLAAGPTCPCPQDAQRPCVAAALQQLQVFTVEDVQGVLETGRVSRLGHLLHELWERVMAVLPEGLFSSYPCPSQHLLPLGGPGPVSTNLGWGKLSILHTGRLSMH